MFFLPGQNFFDIENLFFSSNFIIFLLLLFCIQFGEKLVFFSRKAQHNNPLKKISGHSLRIQNSCNMPHSITQPIPLPPPKKNSIIKRRFFLKQCIYYNNLLIETKYDHTVLYVFCFIEFQFYGSYPFSLSFFSVFFTSFDFQLYLFFVCLFCLITFVLIFLFLFCF